MPISYDLCAPFLSTTLLRIKGTVNLDVANLREAVVTHLKKGSEPGKRTKVKRKIHRNSPEIIQSGSMEVAWIHYSESRPPAWYIGDDLMEERHHAIFIAGTGKLVALTVSDSSLRNTVVAAVRKGASRPFSDLSLLSSKQINDAFLGARVRTLWLSGSHRRTATKADSKILTGVELEAALNPLEDQSYYFSSVRSTLDGARLAAAGSNVIVGATPSNSRVWLGPSKGWQDFIQRISALLDAAALAIKNPTSGITALPILAQPIDGLPAAAEPYDMAIINPEDTPTGGEDSSRTQWLHEFSDAARFQVFAEAGAPSFEAEVLWSAERYGRIRYEFSADAASAPMVKAIVKDWEDGADHQEEIRNICEDTDLLTVYFDTGHTFSRGRFYETQFRDARFSDWKWAKLKGFDVGAEKPLSGKKLKIDEIGDAKDDSLFGFVAKHWPNHSNLGKPTGWLICDDGSMESADFIHFNEAEKPPHLTLIHVKGSGSAAGRRELSVTDYEVVVGQAVKNLRYLDRTKVHEKLASNKDDKIGAAVWHNGIRQKNRDEILKLLEKAGSNMKTTVCIFQPRARKSAVEALAAKRLPKSKGKHHDIRRLQQLDALLLSARASCFGLGADFVVIGEDDTA